MIKDFLKKTADVILGNKRKILVIFFVQVLFFGVLSFVFFNTVVPSMGHAKAAVDYYSSINVTSDSGMFGFLGDDPSIVFDNYREMMSYLKYMGLFSFLAFVIINGFLWVLTDNLFRNMKIRYVIRYMFDFIVLTLGFVFLFYAFIFSLLKDALLELDFNLLPLFWVLILSIVLLYFLYIGYSLIGKNKLKEIPKLMFRLGVFRFKGIILVYLINLLIISLLFYLTYLVVEFNIVLLFVVILLFVIGVIFTRIFLIVGVGKLVKKL